MLRKGVGVDDGCPSDGVLSASREADVVQRCRLIGVKHGRTGVATWCHAPEARWASGCSRGATRGFGGLGRWPGFAMETLQRLDPKPYESGSRGHISVYELTGHRRRAPRPVEARTW